MMEDHIETEIETKVEHNRANDPNYKVGPCGEIVSHDGLLDTPDIECPWLRPAVYLSSNGTKSKATILTTLIMGLMAGPAVSL